jgi:hypothetical protein
MISVDSWSGKTGLVPALGVAVETSSSAMGEGGRSAERTEKHFILVTIVVTVLVRRLRATRVGFLSKLA